MGKDPRKALLKATHFATSKSVGAVPCYMCMHSSSPGTSGQKPMSVLALSFTKVLAIRSPSFFFTTVAASWVVGGHYSHVACSVFPLLHVHTTGLRKLGPVSSLLSDSAPLCLSSPFLRLSILDFQTVWTWFEFLRHPEWKLLQRLGASEDYFSFYPALRLSISFSHVEGTPSVSFLHIKFLQQLLLTSLVSGDCSAHPSLPFSNPFNKIRMVLK